MPLTTPVVDVTVTPVRQLAVPFPLTPVSTVAHSALRYFWVFERLPPPPVTDLTKVSELDAPPPVTVISWTNLIEPVEGVLDVISEKSSGVFPPTLPASMV